MQLTRPKRERVRSQTITPLLVTSKNEVYLSPTELLKLACLVIIYQTPSALSLTFQITKSETKSVLLKASKVAFSCSYHIFNSRNSISWEVNKPHSIVYNFQICHYLFVFLLSFALPRPPCIGANLYIS